MAANILAKTLPGMNGIANSGDPGAFQNAVRAVLNRFTQDRAGTGLTKLKGAQQLLAALKSLSEMQLRLNRRGFHICLESQEDAGNDRAFEALQQATPGLSVVRLNKEADPRIVVMLSTLDTIISEANRMIEAVGE